MVTMRADGGPRPVLIVGAGPADLAAAIELGGRSIPAILIERSPRAGYAPRARTTNVRTRTHLRRWGIADKLAAAAPFGVDYPGHVPFRHPPGRAGAATLRRRAVLQAEPRRALPRAFAGSQVLAPAVPLRRRVGRYAGGDALGQPVRHEQAAAKMA